MAVNYARKPVENLPAVRQSSETLPLIPDELWQRIELVLPPPKPRRSHCPGRKPIDNRKTLAGIFFVLKAGIPWEELPQEMGCGSGMTCWRRLNEWLHAGIWPLLQQMVVAELQDAHMIDWSRVAGDTAESGIVTRITRRNRRARSWMQEAAVAS